jgi:hypothetical protein
MKKLIIIAVLLGGGYVLWAQPWKPKRYNDSPAGQEARKIDNHVQEAFDWRDTTMHKRWPAKEYIGTKSQEGRGYGVGGFPEAKKFVDELYQAGATDVSYINIIRSVRYGDSPGALAVTLPEQPAARAAVFARFAKELPAGKTAPTDVHQKYLYMGFDQWSPSDPSPGFLPD